MADKKNKKQSILTMDVKDIGKSLKRKGNTKIPSKTKMNLYVRPVDGNSLSRVIPVALIIVVLVFAIYQIGVVNRLEKLNQLRSEKSSLESNLEIYEEKLKDYEEVQSNYYRYTRFYLNTDESGLVEKTKVMDLIEETIYPVATVMSTNISGNNINLNVQTKDLESFATMRAALQQYDWVLDVMVYTAAYSEREDSVFGNISFSVTK